MKELKNKLDEMNDEQVFLKIKNLLTQKDISEKSEEYINNVIKIYSSLSDERQETMLIKLNELIKNESIDFLDDNGNILRMDISDFFIKSSKKVQEKNIINFIKELYDFYSDNYASNISLETYEYLVGIISLLDKSAVESNFEDVSCLMLKKLSKMQISDEEKNNMFFTLFKGMNDCYNEKEIIYFCSKFFKYSNMDVNKRLDKIREIFSIKSETIDSTDKKVVILVSDVIEKFILEDSLNNWQNMTNDEKNLLFNI